MGAVVYREGLLWEPLDDRPQLQEPDTTRRDRERAQQLVRAQAQLLGHERIVGA